MRVALHVARRHRIAFADGREDAPLALVVLGRVVEILAVQLEEPVEGDDRADGPEGTAAVPVGDVDRHLIQARALPLRRDGAPPDPLVDGAPFGLQLARTALPTGRAPGR